MGKKKQFIDRSEAATFHLVHRSQRDPKIADPDAPQRVLQPVEGRRGMSEKASQSTRAFLEEQDLGGFDEVAAAARGEGGPSGVPREANEDLGFLDDGYNYSQHMRAMGNGTFVEAPESVASHARSTNSRLSRLSARSRAEGFVLKGMPSEVFETTDVELDVGAGGAYNHMNVVQEEEDGAYLEYEMDEDLWAALHEEEEEEGERKGEYGELND
eukprot:3907874-Prymnesium_polylepis.2